MNRNLQNWLRAFLAAGLLAFGAAGLTTWGQHPPRTIAPTPRTNVNARQDKQEMQALRERIQQDKFQFKSDQREFRKNSSQVQVDRARLKEDQRQMKLLRGNVKHDRRIRRRYHHRHG